MNANSEYSVVLVDDDNMFLVSLKNSLHQQFGSQLKISGYDSGEEFIRNINSTPDIIILDYYLNNDENPDIMNGMHVLDEIKAVSKDTIVIMLSGQDNVQVAIDTLKNGAYEYIAKSESTFVRIQNSVKNAIEKIKSKRESNKYFVLNIRKTILIGIIIVADIICYCAFRMR